MSTSVLDYIFRDLAIAYLDRHELGQVKPEDLEATSAQSRGSLNGIAGHRTAATLKGASPGHRAPEAGEAARDPLGGENGQADNAREEAKARMKAAREGTRVARLKGYEGDPCPVCGHLTLVRNGTCLKCETCGSTTGCS